MNLNENRISQTCKRYEELKKKKESNVIEI